MHMYAKVCRGVCVAMMIHHGASDMLVAAVTSCHSRLSQY